MKPNVWIRRAKSFLYDRWASRLHRRLLRWLRRIEEDGIPPIEQYYLAVVFPGNQVERVKVTGFAGLHLVAETSNGIKLVRASQAFDQMEYWQVWNAFTHARVTFEDGSPFSPN